MKISATIKLFRNISIAIVFVFVTAQAAVMAADATSLSPPHAPIVAGKAVPVVAHPDHKVLLSNKNPKLAANKRLVYDMWRTVMNGGQVEQADKFLTLDYIEHNTMANTGREAFKQRIVAQKNGERMKKVPDKVLDDVVTILAEGDYVAMAFVSHYQEPDGSGKTYTSTKFDIFRIENGLIAEHWDSVQRAKGVMVATPEEGGPVPVVGVTDGLKQLAMLNNDDLALANNKRLVFDLWRHIPEAGREEHALIYLDPIYIQHNPNAVTGRDGFMEYFAKRPDSAIDPFLEDPPIVMIAEGDLVLQALQEEREDPNSGETYYVAWIDMFRIVQGRAAEHWDTASKGEVPAAMREAMGKNAK